MKIMLQSLSLSETQSENQSNTGLSKILGTLSNMLKYTGPNSADPMIFDLNITVN